MEFSLWKNIFIALIAGVVCLAGISLTMENKNYFSGHVVADPGSKSDTAVINNTASQVSLPPAPPPPPEKLSNPPAIIKSVYITGYSAGSKKYLNYLSNLFRNTEINAVVVDVKGSGGYVSYASSAPDVKKYSLTDHEIPDIDTLVRFFHDQNIYVIGRIAVFEDPVYSKVKPNLAVYDKAKTTDLSNPVLWEDNNGLSWMDPASKDVWDYNISLAKDAFYNGFDEVNFDYVRFPTDGNRGNMGFPVYDSKNAKVEVIKSFFQYTRVNLSNEKISADLFGLTTVNPDDMGIGQVIESAMENFDYVCPMVYPSHYANGFIGFANPADHPYDVIKYSLDHALARENVLLEQETGKISEAAGSPASTDQVSEVPVLTPLGKLRPWLQDFNMGAVYTADMVSREIKATQDSLQNNFVGFMLWNPNNIYTEDAVLKQK